jgi:hypothetical protein
MQFNSAPVSTLYVKVNFKRTPYKRDVTALRIVAHIYAEFTSNQALFLVDLPPKTANLLTIEAAVEALKARANAASVSVKMPMPVYKTLARRTVA